MSSLGLLQDDIISGPSRAAVKVLRLQRSAAHLEGSSQDGIQEG